MPRFIVFLSWLNVWLVFVLEKNTVRVKHDCSVKIEVVWDKQCSSHRSKDVFVWKETLSVPTRPTNRWRCKCDTFMSLQQWCHTTVNECVFWLPFKSHGDRTKPASETWVGRSRYLTRPHFDFLYGQNISETACQGAMWVGFQASL